MLILKGSSRVSSHVDTLYDECTLRLCAILRPQISMTDNSVRLCKCSLSPVSIHNPSHSKSLASSHLRKALSINPVNCIPKYQLFQCWDNLPQYELMVPLWFCLLEDMSAENSSTTAMHKSYHSPWDQAILMDPSLAETLKLETSAPDPKQDLPEFKSFNR